MTLDEARLRIGMPVHTNVKGRQLDGILKAVDEDGIGYVQFPAHRCAEFIKLEDMWATN